MASEWRVRAQDEEALDASARRRTDRHRRCRFAVAGVEAAQRRLTEAGVLASASFRIRYRRRPPQAHASGPSIELRDPEPLVAWRPDNTDAPAHATAVRVASDPGRGYGVVEGLSRCWSRRR